MTRVPIWSLQDQLPRTDSGPPAEQALVTGLKTYFNRSCRLLLLYPQERAQAEEVCPIPYILEFRPRTTHDTVSKLHRLQVSRGLSSVAASGVGPRLKPCASCPTPSLVPYTRA